MSIMERAKQYANRLVGEEWGRTGLVCPMKETWDNVQARYFMIATEQRANDVEEFCDWLKEHFGYSELHDNDTREWIDDMIRDVRKKFAYD